MKGWSRTGTENAARTSWIDGDERQEGSDYWGNIKVDVVENVGRCTTWRWLNPSPKENRMYVSAVKCGKMWMAETAACLFLLV